MHGYTDTRDTLALNGHSAGGAQLSVERKMLMLMLMLVAVKSVEFDRLDGWRSGSWTVEPGPWRLAYLVPYALVFFFPYPLC